MISKRFFVTGLLLLIMFAGAAQAASETFRGNTRHTGEYDAGGVQPNNVLKWSFDQMNNPITAPAVSDGTVYFGSNDHNLYAISAADGSVRWKFTTGNMILSPPSVANGIVYFGSTDQQIYAVNAADGSLRWNVHTNSTWDSGIGTSAPAVADGTVYIVSFDKNLYAINADTGSVRWRYPFVPVGAEAGSSPVVANGVVYFGDVNKVVYAVNAADGTEKWRYYGTGSRASSPPPVPVISGGTLYFAGPGPHNITALNADTGGLVSVISRGYLTNWELLSPAVHNGVLYTGGTDMNLYAIDTATGTDLWSYPLGSLLRSSPSISDGVLYAPGMNKVLYAIFIANGTEKWRFSPPNGRGLWGAPVIADGVVYIDGDGADHLYAVGNQQAAPQVFTGRVMAGNTGDLSGTGLRDLPVQMFGSSAGAAPGTLLASTVTDSNGYYMIPSPAETYAYLSLVHTDTITGSVPAGAQTGGGTVKNATWIQFATPLGGKDLTNNNFWDTVPVVHGNFSAEPLSGPAPLTVTFTDHSTGYPTIWNWVLDYNRTIDNGFIVCLSPTCTYTYTEPGLYSVQMRITNPVSHEWVTKLDYISVTAPQTLLPIPGMTTPPTDPDNDGRYEDTNGNGRADFSDVSLYFTQMDWITANEPVAAFDFNGNGRIDFADITALFGEI